MPSARSCHRNHPLSNPPQTQTFVRLPSRPRLKEEALSGYAGNLLRKVIAASSVICILLSVFSRISVAAALANRSVLICVVIA